MPLDPRIALQARAPDVGAAASQFQNALSSVQNRRIQDEQNQRAAELAPLQNALMQTQIDQGQQNVAQSREKARQISVIQGANELLPFLQSGDELGAVGYLENRKRTLVDQSLPTQDTDEAINLINTNPQLLLERTQNAVNVGRRLQAGTSGNIQSSQFIPGRGFATISRTGETGFTPVEGIGETTEEKRKADLAKTIRVEQTKSALKGKDSAVKAAVTKGAKVFDSIEPVGVAIANYDDAISQLDAGAETGVINSMLPSFRTASIKLDNIKKRLGLDVVGNTTFGALSESELKFALDSALPDNLQPAELKEWLVAKRDSQKKVKERLEEAASFLSDGTHTIKDWLAFDTARQLNAKNLVSQQSVIQPQNAAQEIQTIRFDEQANIIQ